MPRTKTKLKRSAPANGPLRDVLTLAEAAAYLRLSEAEVVRLTREQALPARHVGRDWRFLLSAIHDWLSKGKAPESNKDAWSKLVGVWRNDPTLGDLRAEIHKQSRLTSEDAE